MNVEVSRIGRKLFADFMQFIVAESRLYVVFSFVAATEVIVPIFWKAPQGRLFTNRLAFRLRGFKLSAYCLDFRLNILSASFFRVHLPQWRMALDRLIK